RISGVTWYSRSPRPRIPDSVSACGFCRAKFVPKGDFAPSGMPFVPQAPKNVAVPKILQKKLPTSPPSSELYIWKYRTPPVIVSFCGMMSNDTDVYAACWMKVRWKSSKKPVFGLRRPCRLAGLPGHGCIGRKQFVVGPVGAQLGTLLYIHSVSS